MDEKFIQNYFKWMNKQKNVGGFKLCPTCALGSQIWKKMKNKKGGLEKSRSLEHLAFFGWR
jgi:hypothetical protein